MFTRFLLLPLLVKRLGYILYSYLSFFDRISSVSRACFYHICDLRRMRLVLDFYMTRTISTSFVHSSWLLKFHILLFSSNAVKSPSTHPECSCSCRCHSSCRSSNPDHILKSLHRFKAQKRIGYKVISTTYKLLQSSFHVTCTISSQSSFLDPIDHSYWSLSIHQFTTVSKWRTALTDMSHLKLSPTLRRVPYQFDA